MGHQLAGQPTALRTDEIALLLYARHYCKVEGEVGGDDSTDPLLLQLLLTLQVCVKVKKKKPETCSLKGAKVAAEAASVLKNETLHMLVFCSFRGIHQRLRLTYLLLFKVF